jgi:hypothetical protein
MNQRFRGIEIKKVIIVRVAEGDGTAESPVHLVEYIFDENGTKIK